MLSQGFWFSSDMETAIFLVIALADSILNDNYDPICIQNHQHDACAGTRNMV